MKIESCCDRVVDTVDEWASIKSEAAAIANTIMPPDFEFIDLLEEVTPIEIPMSLQTAQKVRKVLIAAMIKAIEDHVEE